MQLFTPYQYLKIAVANAYGLDKESWNTRIHWFDQNQSQMGKLVSEAEEPIMMVAALNAIEKTHNKIPSGFPISLDATASGIQLLSVLTGDIDAAKLCNVIDTGRREDAYTNIYQSMMDELGEEGQITRSDTKKAIMTAFYSSKRQPERIFGEGTPLLQLFYRTLEEKAPRAWELNNAFLQMWNPEALKHSWVLPDNFHVDKLVIGKKQDSVHFKNGLHSVTYKVNTPKEKGRSLGADTVHSVDGFVVREMVRRCSYDPERIAYVRRIVNFLPMFSDDIKELDNNMVLCLWDHYQKSGILSARILDHINSHNIHLIDVEVIKDLLDTLPEKPFELIAVHDCFRVLPSYGNDLRKQYNQMLYEIAKSNLLKYLLEQILGRELSLNTHNQELIDGTLNANYALS